MSSTNINLPFISMSADGPQHLDVNLTKQKFEAMTAELLNRTVEPMRLAMKDAGLTYKDIDKVILVGGSTRMPAVVEKVREITAKSLSKESIPMNVSRSARPCRAAF